MPYPPPVLPINRTNADPQQDTHPNDHNALALAVNDITTELGPNPGGIFANLSDRLNNAIPTQIRGTTMTASIATGQEATVATFPTPSGGAANRAALLTLIGTWEIVGDPLITVQFKDGGGGVRFRYVRYPATNGVTYLAQCIVWLTTAAETFSATVQCGGAGGQVNVNTDVAINAAYGILLPF